MCHGSQNCIEAGAYGVSPGTYVLVGLLGIVGAVEKPQIYCYVLPSRISDRL